MFWKQDRQITVYNIHKKLHLIMNPFLSKTQTETCLLSFANFQPNANVKHYLEPIHDHADVFQLN